MQPSRPISAAYIQPLGIEPLQAAYAPLGIGFTSATYTIPTILMTSLGHGRELSNLAKIYTNNKKYSDRNDSFIFKLAIFHNICLRADVLPETKMKAFPTMLKGLVLDYYYSNISIYAIVINFDQVCNSIKNYFEGVKYKQSVLLKKNKLIFKSVISKSKVKPMEEYLKKLIDKLWHL